MDKGCYVESEKNILSSSEVQRGRRAIVLGRPQADDSDVSLFTTSET